MPFGSFRSIQELARSFQITLKVDTFLEPIPVAPDDRGRRVGLEGWEEGGLPEREGGQSYVRINARTGCGEKEDEEDGQERRRSAPRYQRAPCLRRSACRSREENCTPPSPLQPVAHRLLSWLSAYCHA